MGDKLLSLCQGKVHVYQVECSDGIKVDVIHELLKDLSKIFVKWFDDTYWHKIPVKIDLTEYEFLFILSYLYTDDMYSPFEDFDDKLLNIVRLIKTSREWSLIEYTEFLENDFIDRLTLKSVLKLLPSIEQYGLTELEEQMLNYIGEHKKEFLILTDRSKISRVPANSLYYFKMLWNENRNKTINKYCTPEMIESMAEYMKTTNLDDDTERNIRTKRSAEEFKFIWNTYVRSDLPQHHWLITQIKEDYGAYVKNFNNDNNPIDNNDVQVKKEDLIRPIYMSRFNSLSTEQKTKVLARLFPNNGKH